MPVFVNPDFLINLPTLCAVTVTCSWPVVVAGVMAVLSFFWTGAARLAGRGLRI